MSSTQEPGNQREGLYAKAQEVICKDIERIFGVLQEKWNIISHPLKFMQVSTTEIVIKCCIILNNMCFEKRTAKELEKDVTSAEILWDGGVKPMWGSLVWLIGQSVVPAGAGSITAVYEMERFIKNQTEYKWTKHMLIQHVWDSFGEDAM